MVGADGVDVAIQFSFQEDGSATSELRISGALLQPLISLSTDLSCASLACSLLKAAPGQTALNSTDQDGVALLTLGAATNTFANAVSAPVLESTGDLLVSGNATVGGTLS